MHYYIQYQEDFYKSLNIEITPTMTGALFFKILELIRFPISEQMEGLTKFAINELITNSIRASREQSTNNNIKLCLKIHDDFLFINIIDFAGGFDITQLPYDVNKNPHELDLLSETFDEYRTENKHLRFGVGLLSSRKILTNFRMYFFDKNGNEKTWDGEGSVSGTKIEAKIKLDYAAQDDLKINQERRKSKRQTIFTHIIINEEKEAYLIDFTPEGAKIMLFFSDIIKKGDDIRVTMCLNAKSDKVTIPAKVIWESTEYNVYQAGLFFKINDPELTATLLKFYTSLKYDPLKVPGVYIIADKEN